MDGQDGGSRRSTDADSDTPSSVLGSERCRHALSCLWEHGTALALADVAEEVATRERETRITEIPAEEVKEVYMSLYHDHRPELVRRGLVEYDQERDLIRPARYAGRVIRRLAVLDDRSTLQAGGGETPG